jgi:hypothetical protein
VLVVETQLAATTFVPKQVTWFMCKKVCTLKRKNYERVAVNGNVKILLSMKPSLGRLINKLGRTFAFLNFTLPRVCNKVADPIAAHGAVLLGASQRSLLY